MSEHTKWTPTDEQRDEALNALRMWRSVLRLENVRISICWCVPEGEDSCVACTRSLPHYKDMRLCIHPELWSAQDQHPDKRRLDFLHEIMHFVLSPYRQLARKIMVDEKFVTWREVNDTEEEITTYLAKLVKRLLDGREVAGGEDV